MAAAAAAEEDGPEQHVHRNYDKKSKVIIHGIHDNENNKSSSSSSSSSSNNNKDKDKHEAAKRRRGPYSSDTFCRLTTEALMGLGITGVPKQSFEGTKQRMQEGLFGKSRNRVRFQLFYNSRG